MLPLQAAAPLWDCRRGDWVAFLWTGLDPA